MRLSALYCLPDSTEVWAHAVVERIEEWWGGRKETVLYSNMQDNTDKRRYRQHSSKTMASIELAIDTIDLTV